MQLRGGITRGGGVCEMGFVVERRGQDALDTRGRDARDTMDGGDGGHRVLRGAYRGFGGGEGMSNNEYRISNGEVRLCGECGFLSCYGG